MAELTTITVKGFKSIAAIEQLQIGAINVVIGPNGSGKSNLIALFRFLQAMRGGRLQEYVASWGWITCSTLAPRPLRALVWRLPFVVKAPTATNFIWNRVLLLKSYLVMAERPVLAMTQR